MRLWDDGLSSNSEPFFARPESKVICHRAWWALSARYQAKHQAHAAHDKFDLRYLTPDLTYFLPRQLQAALRHTPNGAALRSFVHASYLLAKALLRGSEDCSRIEHGLVDIGHL